MSIVTFVLPVYLSIDNGTAVRSYKCPNCDQRIFFLEAAYPLIEEVSHQCEECLVQITVSKDELISYKILD